MRGGVHKPRVSRLGMRVDAAATLRHVRKVAPTVEPTKGEMRRTGGNMIK